MTRKDYEAIATALCKALEFSETQNQRRGVQRSALCIADVLAEDNVRFDRARFLAACGVQS